jgi:hypothetical protein
MSGTMTPGGNLQPSKGPSRGACMVSSSEIAWFYPGQT